MRRQAVGVVQDGGDRQVFTAYRAIDDDAQSAHCGEGVNRTPIAACAIVIEDEHRSGAHCFA